MCLCVGVKRHLGALAAGKIDDRWYEERRRTLMETLDDRAGAGGVAGRVLFLEDDRAGVLAEDIVREHARLGGFPADSVNVVNATISPATAER